VDAPDKGKLAPAHRETSLWAEHRDINDVMLATSLMPEGFLRAGAPLRADPLA
jgi:hypothetical protein